MNNSEVDYLFKILFVGDNFVGKSCALLRYAEQQFGDSYISTIGVDFKNKQLMVDGAKCKLQLWDHPRGCERFRNITSAYYRGLHGIIFFYDITNVQSFNSIKNQWYNEYSKHRLEDRTDKSKSQYNYGYDYSTYSPQVLVLGTKSDLRNQSNYNSCVDFNQVREYAKSINALSFEVSIKENIGLDESIYEMISSLLQNYIKANGKKKNEINPSKPPSSSTSSPSSRCVIN